MKNLNLSWDDIDERADTCISAYEKNNFSEPLRIYGVPRGGIYAAQAISKALWRKSIPNRLVSEWCLSNLIVDDIIDSGKTRDFYHYETGGRIHFLVLVDKLKKDFSLKGIWVSFPWERMNNDDGPIENIRRLIEYIGEDPAREGLVDTPKRVIASYKKLYGGYNQKPSDVIKVFEEACDEMVLVKDIEFYSTCEHHMLPFSGKAHIAYVPDKKVIGISKLVRILEIYTRRLQIQERICRQVTEALQDLLKPLGVACVLEATHNCMTSRGVEKQHSIMVTSSLTGVFKEKSEARSEFMSMIGK